MSWDLLVPLIAILTVIVWAMTRGEGMLSSSTKEFLKKHNVRLILLGGMLQVTVALLNTLATVGRVS